MERKDREKLKERSDCITKIGKFSKEVASAARGVLSQRTDDEGLKKNLTTLQERLANLQEHVGLLAARLGIPPTPVDERQLSLIPETTPVEEEEQELTGELITADNTPLETSEANLVVANGRGYAGE